VLKAPHKRWLLAFNLLINLVALGFSFAYALRWTAAFKSLRMPVQRQEILLGRAIYFGYQWQLRLVLFAFVRDDIASVHYLLGKIPRLGPIIVGKPGRLEW